MAQRWLLQKGTKHIYHWTPIQAAKQSMIEVSQDQVVRILAGEDPNTVVRLAEQAEAMKDHTMIAVPNEFVSRVNLFIAGGCIETVVADPLLKADAEFADAAPPVDAPAEDEAPNLRSVEVVKIEKTTSKNVVEDMNKALPVEFQADINREMEMKDMKAAVIAAYQAVITAGA